jgi:hypothetical protein
MGKRRQKVLPSDIQQVQHRIEHWRETREKRTAMPEPLWEAAICLTQEHGIHQTARALRLSYESLKRRVVASPSHVQGGQKEYASFVDIGPAQLLGMAQPTGPVVEFSRADGAKLMIRLTDISELDMASLVEAFWRGRS